MKRFRCSLANGMLEHEHGPWVSRFDADSRIEQLENALKEAERECEAKNVTDWSMPMNRRELIERCEQLQAALAEGRTLLAAAMFRGDIDRVEWWKRAEKFVGSQASGDVKS